MVLIRYLPKRRGKPTSFKCGIGRRPIAEEWLMANGTISSEPKSC